MAQYLYSIGTSTGAMVNVETLAGGTFPPPKSTFRPYSMPLDLGDGSVRGGGWAEAEWRWGFLTRAQRDAIRAYCTQASAAVYIYTRTNDNTDAYATYQAAMIWPQAEEKESKGDRPDFVLTYRRLIPSS
jgi:hypothetical protein